MRAFILKPVFLSFVLAAPVWAMPLNDTGQTKCYDGSALVACTASNTGDSASHPRQDGRFGRDAQALAGSLTKTGGGNAGFDFTPLDASGNPITLDSDGNPTATHSCVKDNVTNLIWEVKTSANYLDTTSLSGGNAYAANKNSVGMCGYTSGWRVPTRQELLSIVDYGRSSSPRIDVVFFPYNYCCSPFLTSDLYASDSGFVWSVNFNTGTSSAYDKTSFFFIARLVRTGP